MTLMDEYHAPRRHLARRPGRRTRLLIVLDGVMQAPGGPEEDPSDAFTHGGWQAPFADPAAGEFVTELNSHASAFLFGRRTFEIFRGYWPDQTGPANPIATAINSLPKYVVSNSLSEADAT